MHFEFWQPFDTKSYKKEKLLPLASNPGLGGVGDVAGGCPQWSYSHPVPSSKV